MLVRQSNTKKKKEKEITYNLLQAFRKIKALKIEKNYPRDPYLLIFYLKLYLQYFFKYNYAYFLHTVLNKINLYSMKTTIWIRIKTNKTHIV